MILIRAPLRIWIVNYRPFSAVTNACIIGKSVISSDEMEKITWRTESIDLVGRTNNTFKHKAVTSDFDEYKILLATLKKVSHRQTCTFKCQKNQGKQTILCGSEKFHRHLLGMSQYYFKPLYRSFCKTSSGGEDAGANHTWENLVIYEKLSPEEVKIHEKHRDAVKVYTVKLS